MDDLESCFWVALWSVIFNRQHEKYLKPLELEIRDKLAGGLGAEAMFLVDSILPEQSSDVMNRFLPVLRVWWGKVREMKFEWGNIMGSRPTGADERYYLPRFHLSALQGIVDILEVMSRYWNDEISWESWSSPLPPAVSR